MGVKTRAPWLPKQGAQGDQDKRAMVRWRVVGGQDKGGIVVRAGKSLQSEAYQSKLPIGCVVAQIELVGQRLKYQFLSLRLDNEGDKVLSVPPTGWVSTSVAGKELLVKEPLVEFYEMDISSSSKSSRSKSSSSKSSSTSSRNLLPNAWRGRDRISIKNLLIDEMDDISSSKSSGSTSISTSSRNPLPDAREGDDRISITNLLPDDYLRNQIIIDDIGEVWGHPLAKEPSEFTAKELYEIAILAAEQSVSAKAVVQVSEKHVADAKLACVTAGALDQTAAFYQNLYASVQKELSREAPQKVNDYSVCEGVFLEECQEVAKLIEQQVVGHTFVHEAVQAQVVGAEFARQQALKLVKLATLDSTTKEEHARILAKDSESKAAIAERLMAVAEVATAEENEKEWEMEMEMERERERKQKEDQHEQEDEEQSTCMSKFCCPICSSQVSLGDVFNMEGCAHTFCRDCARAQVLVEIKEHRLPRCACCIGPREERTLLSQAAAEMILNPEEMQRFYDLELEVWTAEKRVLRCPTPDCTGLVEVDPQFTGLQWHCPTCSESICVKCARKWHPGTACNQSDKQSDDEQLETWRVKEGASRCPRCKAVIERIEGCPHMTCRCGTHFCYNCNQERDPLNPYAHVCRREPEETARSCAECKAVLIYGEYGIGEYRNSWYCASCWQNWRPRPGRR